MRVAKLATVAWGVVQLAVAIGAQAMNQSVLDAGLAVLSLAAGAVLGAFLLGTLAPTIRERDVFAGMIAGLIVIAVVWWATPIAFTWYLIIGAGTTCAAAFVVRATVPARADTL
jgi:Na+/proline symporter